ncbi:hypothetical protein UFOVP1020_29 [uncultured Caudovirales phage]|uniref:Uncharacterized protein n=1 Tax=uncultured Caudovirales phage TaxID=2100421 RepID=A0A6J5R339_9CAUD|nr:hypothetical protein UFOVP512_34 [uncultured Caudovirales phage]CAB4178688.1 hypothetical protein UFOVP1020_29 [uncultured Caudovirales phage]CAB4187971.1 hypothetical protein UFOVP1170_24 [uncultured Caudovirales phage]CAB4220362.1 hypothetical protein UFOVP1621_21 [uncultured Caudovirales phage]
MADLFDRYGVAPTAQGDPSAGVDLFAQYAPQGGVQDWEPQAYTGGQKAARVVGVGAQGFNDAIAGTVGAPVDVSNWLNRNIPGLRTAGQFLLGPSDATRARVEKITGSGAAPQLDQAVGGSDSIKTGLDYIATLPGRVSDVVTQRSLNPLADNRTSRMEPLNQTERITQGVGEGVGNALSIAAPFGVIARGAQTGTMTQGVAQTLASQPVMQTVAGGLGGGVTGATDNPWLGLAASAAVPLAAMAGRGIISPVTNVLTPQEQRLAAAAGREGIPLTPAQQTGSRALQQIEGTMAKIPGSSGPMQRAVGEQRQAFNSAVLQRAGVNATDASPETMARAFQTAKQTFDDLAARTTLNVDNQFVNDVTRAARDYGRRLETNVAPIFQSYMDDLAPLLQAAQSGGNPQIAGEIYATIRSDIGKTIRSNGKNPDLQRALGAVQTALDDVVERSTTGALRGEWRDARREYQALMTVDKAMRGGTQVDRSAGDIPLGALKSVVATADPAGFSRGRGQLNELARVGDFIGQRVPDSGTATRNAVANPLMWPVMLAGNVAGRAYNTAPVQNYLTNQAAGNTNLRALYGSIAAQQALEESRGGPNALRPRGAQ